MMTPEKLDRLMAGTLCIGWLMVALWFVYEFGYVEGRQSMPVALEPSCVELRQTGRTPEVLCPDSLGRLDYGQR